MHVTLPTAPPFEEYIHEIEDIWDLRVFTNGRCTVLNQPVFCDINASDYTMQ